MDIWVMAFVALVALSMPTILALRFDRFFRSENSTQTLNTLGFDERRSEIQRILAYGEISEAEADELTLELEHMYVNDMYSAPSVSVKKQSCSIQAVLVIGGMMMLVAGLLYARLGSLAEVWDLRDRVDKVNPVVATFLQDRPLSEEVIENTSLSDFALALQIRIQKNPRDAEAWLKLGQLMLTIPLLESAEIAFQRALDEDPVNFEAASRLIQVDLQRNAGSVSHVSRRVIASLEAANANTVKVQMLAGLVAYRSSDFVQAKSIWEGLLNQVQGSDRVVVEQSLAMTIEKIEHQPKTSDRRINVNVQISDNVQMHPDMRLFVVVKALDGSKIPLLVKSFSTFDRHMSVELSAADAMMPGASLDQHNRVTIDAIVSLSGSADRAKGNWIATPTTVDFTQQAPWQVELNVNSQIQ